MAQEAISSAAESSPKKSVKKGGQSGSKSGAKKKRIKKNISVGVVHVLSTFNNTLVTVSDTSGNVISWSSSGSKGFKGSKKSTPFAAQLATEDAVRAAMDHGLSTVSVKIKGPGSGREAALRAIANLRLKVTFIKDVTPIPHNGCRPPKRRRV